ncbi:glycosyltransferase [Malikia sp.]|uniref:glycosyltransferase n=1 Tax=Malikia sp. TaxID=2070706 RepID=UPI00260C9642|nr:glycosyltransferase [Malikia sp.]MDD2727797.1 glycosyltransferase [Malikia sp.]
MLSHNITVCIFAWNEEQRILRCIENFKGFFDIVIVDNCSTDRTVEVVREAGYRTITVKNPGFIETPEVMGPVCDACNTDYVLIASVSEFIPLVLLQRYAEVANGGTHDVVRAYRESITAGQPIPISGRPTKRFPGELRFFKKGAVDYANNEVHGRGRMACTPDRVLSLVTDSRLHFFQFRDYDCSQTELKHRSYNDVLAKQRYDSGTRFSWLRMMLHATKQFLDAYVRFGSWRYGMLGFMHSFYRWYMEVGIWFRIWEWEHRLSRDGVIQQNDAMRKKLEQEVAQFVAKPR